jgi:hypothetical protein
MIKKSFGGRLSNLPIPCEFEKARLPMCFPCDFQLMMGLTRVPHPYWASAYSKEKRVVKKNSRNWRVFLRQMRAESDWVRGVEHRQMQMGR